MLVDINMNTAYYWANKLAGPSHLKITLDINQQTHLILEIDETVGRYIKYDLSGSGLFKNFSETVKEIFLNRIDDLVRHYIPGEMNEKYRKSIGLRLWSSCLSAAKTIALETRAGQNTPDNRTEIFQYLDQIAVQDPIYTAGVESAPLFKKERQQCYSFNGVPLTSPVRRYPNEYLVDK
ncbi:MAG: hypothetical protein WBZ36_27850 [Candidatus Nitrosopolaris sp.]